MSLKISTLKKFGGRSRVHRSPREGLQSLKVLENVFCSQKPSRKPFYYRRPPKDLQFVEVHRKLFYFQSIFRLFQRSYKSSKENFEISRIRRSPHEGLQFLKDLGKVFYSQKAIFLQKASRGSTVCRNLSETLLSICISI